MKSFPFQITYKGKAVLPFTNETQKECFFYEVASKRPLSAAIHHHILIIDFQGNQEEEREQLKKCLIKTLDVLCKKGKHYVSLLAYKKHEGLVRVLSSIRCDRAFYKMAEIDQLIEEATQLTCQGPLSQSLEVALELTKRLKEHCDAQHITLFTDGFSSSPIGEEGEVETCMQLCRRCYEDEISLNLIALGTYYDSQFLKSLIQDSSSSELLHVEQIADYEGAMALLITRVEAISKDKINVQNKTSFLCETRHYYTNAGSIQGLSEKGINLLVTYDEPLQLLDTKVKVKKQETLSQVIPYYLYQFGAYLVKEGDIETAEEVIAETGDIATYKKVCSIYSTREKGSFFKELIQLAEKPQKRYKEGKQIIDRQTLKREEPLCLLEILSIILNDAESKLFWDYSYPYERIGPAYRKEELAYAFIKPTLGYGEIEKVCIGSKKLNIGVQVKINGQVEELKTHLKLDAAVYREYNIIVNGNLNTKYLITELSRKVRAQLRKQGVIKVAFKQDKKVFHKLQLEKLKVVNARIIEQITAEQVAGYLYELEIIKLRESYIRKYLKNIFQPMQPLTKKQLKLYERFHINEKGLFETKQQGLDYSLPVSYYKAEVVEWKIEKFPKKKLEDEIIEDYHLDHLKSTAKQIKQLQESLSELKQKKQLLNNAVQLIRIGSTLMNKPIFNWEHTVIKPKRQATPLAEGNTVVGECMHVSTVQIQDLFIKEERYILMVTHH